MDHARPAQVEVTVLEPGLLADVFRLVRRKGRCRCLVQDRQGRSLDLDGPGGQFRVGHARFARHALALDLDHVLVAQLISQIVGLFELGMEDDLREAFAVVQVDEDHAAVVAVAIDPAGQVDRLADLFDPQGAAGMSALEHGGSLRASEAS